MAYVEPIHLLENYNAAVSTNTLCGRLVPGTMDESLFIEDQTLWAEQESEVTCVFCLMFAREAA